MFLFFEMDLPFGLPPQFMDTVTKNKYENIINENIQTSGSDGASSEMAVPVILAVPSDDSSIPMEQQTGPGSPSQQSAEMTQSQPQNQDVFNNQQPSVSDNEDMSDPSYYDQEQSPEQQEPTQPDAFSQEVEPLKKLFLINKLTRLNYLLADRNIVDSSIKTILKYGPYLSYQTLLRLSSKIIERTTESLNNYNQNVAENPKQSDQNIEMQN